ncbi:MAG: sensor histidine kinase [Flavobacteriales bacterium]|nr:sensor histidine kinase [Flavobacteriales bacterium]
MIRQFHFKRILALIFVLTTVQASAQFNGDSLLRVHVSGKADVTTYADLIWVYVFSKPDSAIYFGKRGLAESKLMGVDSLLGSIHNRMGVAYDVKSMADSALYHYHLALSEAQRTSKPKTEAGALNNIGLIYWNQGATEKAIDHYIRSAGIFEKIGDEVGLANNYNNIGLILSDDHQYDKSLRYHRQALQIRIKTNNKYGIAASYANIAQVFLFQNKPDLDSAEHYLLLAIPIKVQLNDRYGLARAYNSLADVYLKRKDFGKALEFFIRTLRIQQAIGNSEGYASTYYNISEVYLKKDDRKTMLIYLDSAETVAELHNDKALLWKIYWSKARTLSKLGRFEEAYPYWVRFTAIKDSLVNAERSLQVQELETQYRTAEQEAEIADKKVALAEAKLKLENRTKWIAGLLGGLISFLLFGFALFQVYRRKTQAEKDAAIIAERERGLVAMIEATEEERKRIAKDLHDGIVQTLTGLSLRLQKGFSMIKDTTEEQKQRYQESKEMLDDSIAEVRNISHQMMPRALSDMGLIPALEDMLNKSLGSTDIVYEFEHHRMEGERFPENMEVSLYRICQELINNIIKHSQAKGVSVQLLKTKTHLVLVVEDNGKGFKFDSRETRNGIGLMNISSRAKAINGEVNYQPSPKQGTVATIRIPLP